MRVGNVILCIACVLWAAMLWIGIDLIKGITDRHLQGYPDSGQVFSFIGIPSMVIATLLMSGIVFNFLIRSPRMLKYSSITSLIVLVFYFLSLGGGV
jgi:hypothetical protein